MPTEGKEHWTLQQFTEVAGKPWYALQQHSDKEVKYQFTGYRHEVDAMAQWQGITPELLPPTTEEEFLKRGMADQEASPDDDSEEGRFLARASRPGDWQR